MTMRMTTARVAVLGLAIGLWVGDRFQVPSVQDAQAQPNPNPSPIPSPCPRFNVCYYGAKLERVDLDSTAAFQAALNDAASVGGRKVVVPYARFRLDGYLIMAHGVSLVGDGTGPYDPMWSVMDRLQGPTLLITAKSGATGQPFITVVGSNGSIDDLIFAYPEQVKANDPGVGNLGPRAYPPTIRVFMPTKIRRCLFANGYQDVDIKVGRVTLEDDYLGGLKNSVTVDSAWDVVRINSSMIEPFSDWGLKPLQPLDWWMLNNATGIIAKKADSLQINDTLIFGRKVAISFEPSAEVLDGGVSGMASNVNCDTVRFCVVASATEERIGFVFTNLLMGPIWDKPDYAIWLPSPPVASSPARISVVSGSMRQPYKRGNRGVGFQVDGAGELYVSDVVGFDRGPILLQGPTEPTGAPARLRGVYQRTQQ